MTVGVLCLVAGRGGRNFPVRSCWPSTIDRAFPTPIHLGVFALDLSLKAFPLGSSLRRLHSDVGSLIWSRIFQGRQIYVLILNYVGTPWVLRRPLHRGSMATLPCTTHSQLHLTCPRGGPRVSRRAAVPDIILLVLKM